MVRQDKTTWLRGLTAVALATMLFLPASCVLLSDFDDLTGNEVLTADASAEDHSDTSEAAEPDAAVADADAETAEADATADAAGDDGGDGCAWDAASTGARTLVSQQPGHVWALTTAEGDPFVYWTVHFAPLADGGFASALMRADRCCSDGSCGDRIATLDSTELSDLAVDDTWIYVGEIDTQSIVRVHKQSGQREVLAAGQEEVAGLAIDSMWVYWSGVDTSVGGYLRRTMKTAGQGDAATQPPHDLLSGLDEPFLLAFDAYSSRLFWGSPVDAKIQSCRPVIAGAGSDCISAKVLSSGTLPVQTNDTPYVFKLTVDVGHVYWREGVKSESAFTHGALRRVSKNGGDSELLAQGAYRPRWLAIDETNVYWDNGLAGEVYRTTKEPGGPIVPLADGQLPDAHSLALANDGLYVGLYQSGEIWRIQL